MEPYSLVEGGGRAAASLFPAGSPARDQATLPAPHAAPQHLQLSRFLQGVRSASQQALGGLALRGPGPPAATAHEAQLAQDARPAPARNRSPASVVGLSILINVGSGDSGRVPAPTSLSWAQPRRTKGAPRCTYPMVRSHRPSGPSEKEKGCLGGGVDIYRYESPIGTEKKKITVNQFLLIQFPAPRWTKAHLGKSL